MSICEHLINVPMEDKFPGVIKMGNSYKLLCPFHSDKNPSLSVFPEGNYYCFACGEKGNYVSFLMKTRSLTISEAYEEIENLTGVRSRQDSHEKTEFHEINERAAQFFAKQLDKNPQVRNYLAKRGITDESIKKFRIGYASGEGLLKELKNWSSTQIRRAGLLMANEEREFFQERLIFPIMSEDGKIYGFAGRTLKNNGVKYINSPETVFFKKSSFLYGLSTQAVKKQGIIIVEGYIDAIALHQKGYDNTVALMGTAFTERQLDIVRQITDRAIIAGDGDPAGVKATIKIAKQLIRYIDVAVVDFGDEDPASFIEKGGNVAEVLAKGKSAAVYLMEKVADISERREIIHALAVKNSAPDFLSALDKRERYLFTEISARELLSSMREKMKPLIRLKNTEIEVRQWGENAVAFLRDKMVATIKLPKDTKKHKDISAELARGLYKSLVKAQAKKK